jgi:hypothetical protein
VIFMTNPTPDRRAQLIAGLREFASYLDDHPHIPAPRYVDIHLFPNGPDEAMRAEVDRIAAVLGSTPEEGEQGDRYAVTRMFGPLVTLRVVALFARARADHQALMTYAGAVQPETPGSDQTHTTDMEVR